MKQLVTDNQMDNFIPFSLKNDKIMVKSFVDKISHDFPLTTSQASRG